MDNKQFKKILKESLSTGASFLFEEEEVADEETAVGEEDSSNLTEVAKQLLALIDISKNDLETIKASNKLDDDSFAKAMAYYYVARYYDDQENFSMSLNTPRDFDRSIKFVLQEVEKAAENVVCFFDEVVMWSMKSKMYANPQSFVEKLQQKTDEETFRTLSLKLSDNHKNKFKISSSNSSLLKKLIASLPKDFDLSKCGTSKESEKLRTKEQQPMSLESLKAMIKKTDARDYATKIITALKQDMKDLRVRVNEAREKTPLLTNTIKALQSIPNKEIQKVALKSILDFFRVNNLQINGKTQSKLVKAGILARQGSRKPQSNDRSTDKESTEDDEAQDKEQKFNADLEKDDSIDKEEKEVIKSTASQVKDKLGQAALAAWYGLPVDNLYNIIKEGASGNIKGVIGNIFMMLIPLDAGTKMMQAAGLGDSFSNFTDKIKEGDFLQAWDELVVALEPLDPLSKIHMLRTFATFMGKQGPRLGTIIAIIDAIGLMLAAGSAAGVGTATTGVGGGAAAAATAAGWKVAVSKILKNSIKPALVWLIEKFGKTVGYSDKELAQIKKNPEGTIKNKDWVIKAMKGVAAEDMAKALERGIRDKAFKVIQDSVDENSESDFERADTEEVPRPNPDNNEKSDPEGLFTESLFNHAPNFNEQRFDMLLERFDIK